MKDEKYYQEHIASVLDFPKKGINFRDITLTLEHPEAFNNVIKDLSEIASHYEFNKIMCADARGFIFGAPLAYNAKKSLVIARKPNKLPRPGESFSYSLEYGENTLVISEGSIQKGDKVLIVDDLLATGGSSIAMMKIAQKIGATPVAALFYIELIDLKGKDAIKKTAPIDVVSLVKYEGE